MVLLGSLNLPIGEKGEACRGILGTGWSSDSCRLRFDFLSLSFGSGWVTVKGHSAWVSSSGRGRLRAVAMTGGQRDAQ